MTIKLSDIIPLPDKRGPLSRRKLPAKEHQRLEESVRESDRRKWEAHQKFKTWLAQCDKIVASKLGVGLHDMPDANWRDYYDDGLTPHDACDCAFEDQWRGEGAEELWQ
jgi:hypothetical protein